MSSSPSIKRIKWFEAKPLVALAPMEAVTDRAYRTVVRRIAPEVILYTEFVPCMGLKHGGERVWRMAEFDDEERPLIVQIYDHDLDAIEYAAREVAKNLKPDGIDLNMGCPVKKVAARGAGCGMMADPEKSAEAIKRMVDNSNGIPVSAKMRLGISKKDEVLEVSQAVVEAGAQQVSIHARLKSDRPRVPADWDALSIAAKELDVVVMGNGDIWSVEDGQRMMDLDGIDGIMIGRGAIGNPWLLQRCWQTLAGVEVDSPPNKNERVAVAIDHLRMNVESKGERRGVLELRKVVRNYIKGYSDSRQTWLRIIESETELETAKILEDFARNGEAISLADV